MNENVSIKEAMKSMILDKIEWQKDYKFPSQISVWKIHSRPQSFGTLM